MADEQGIAIIDQRGDALESTASAPARDYSPGSLLRVAIERDLPIEKIQQLLDLQERWERTSARKAYIAAMSDLKREDCPTIIKDRQVRYKAVSYDHASLAHIASQCVSALAKHGFHHDWDVTQDKGSVQVSCVVTHCQGHSGRKTLVAPPDTSGTKNAIQAIASTVTYLERYTLLMALGLAPGDDDDGRASGPPVAKQAAGPTPLSRAEKAISVWGRYLGREHAQPAMEQLIGKPAAQWADPDYAVLMEVWAVARGLSSPQEKTAALQTEINRRTSGEGQ